MSHVQSIGFWDDTGDPQTSVPLAFSSNVTSGNVMIAACFFNENDITPTVSDSRGSTWALGQRYWNAGEAFGVIWYWAVVPTNGANTVTFNFSTPTSQVRVALLEESGVDTVSPIDGLSGNLTFFADNNTDGVGSGNFTPSVNNTRIVGIAFMTGAVTLTAGTNFTLHVGSSTIRTWLETRTLATAAANAATFTMASLTSIGGVIGLALKPAAAESSVTVDHAQAVFQGQAIPLHITAPLINAQAVFQGQSVGASAGGSRVELAVYAQAAFEPQEIPFIFGSPGEHAEAVVEGQEISFTLQYSGNIGQAVFEGQNVDLRTGDSVILDIEAAHAVFAPSVINLAVTGVANADDMVQDDRSIVRPMSFTLTDTDR